MRATATCPLNVFSLLDLRSVTQTLRVAREGTIDDERQPRTHSCPSQQRPAPAACCEETLRSVTVVSLHVETRLASLPAALGGGLEVSSPLSTTPPHRVASLSGFDMTFRRLKKVNSSGPGSGPASQDGDIYFPSSKSDSCTTAGFPTNSSEVYNYRTLAYSGGTLPRNFKKVKVNAKRHIEFIFKVLISFLLLKSSFPTLRVLSIH